MVLAPRGDRASCRPVGQRFKPNTAANRPSWKCWRSPSRPPWKHGKPSTNRARWQSSATPWRTQAVEVVGSQRKLSKLIADITGPTTRRSGAAITGKWCASRPLQLANVAETRSTWQVNHIRAEAQRLLRYLDHPGGPEVVNRIVTTALGEHSIALTTHADTEMNEPVALRRRDGESVYTGHDTTVYTSAQVMAAEQRILAAAAKGGGRVVDDTSIGLALLEAHAQHGFELNDGQQQLVKTMATSGARPPGAGPGRHRKNHRHGGAGRRVGNSGGNVIGLAPTASAAEVLAEDTGVTTDTMAKFVRSPNPRDRRCGPPPAPDDPARKWFKTIGSNTLLIVDEAGKASTFDLDAVIGHALARGASVRLVGDDQQLASISASGVISDIAARHETLTLSTVVRFADPGESAASLAMREGDPAGIAYYIDHRACMSAPTKTPPTWPMPPGPPTSQPGGTPSCLHPPTNRSPSSTNGPPGPSHRGGGGSDTVTLGDGLTASAGDWIATRKNARWLRLKASNGWVKNGHRWVIRTYRDGSVTVSPLRGRAKDKTVRLPADYIAAHTTLGYACTIDSAQGVTAGGATSTAPATSSAPIGSPASSSTSADPRQKRKPHLLLHRRSRPSPRPGAQSHPSPDRRRHPLGDPAPRRRQVSAHSAAAAESDRSPGCTAPPRCTPTRSPQPPNTPPARPPWPTSTPPPSRSAPTSPTTAPGRCCGATWPCWPSMATTRSRRYTPPPPPGKPHRRRRGARLAAADTARVGRRAGRSAALAGGRPRRAGRPPAVGPLPARALQLVGDLADQIRAAARQWQPGTVPAWARPCWLSNPS